MSVTGAAAEVAALDAIGQAELVRRREVMPKELVTWAIERIEHLNPQLNAVVTLMFDQALTAAQLGCSGPFAGVPYLLKDLAAETAGVRFTEGSRFLRGYVSRYDSELVRRLRRAGLVRSVRGPHGGHLLSRPAAEIRLDEVIGCLEGGSAAGSDLQAGPATLPALERLAREAELAARRVFAAHTLADLLRLQPEESPVFHGIFKPLPVRGRRAVRA